MPDTGRGEKAGRGSKGETCMASELMPARYVCHLRQLRLARGYSQWEVARALGVNQAIIAKYEAGTVPVPMRRIGRLMEFFECRLEELIEFRDE
jgi:predicted transcriptional regulator